MEKSKFFPTYILRVVSVISIFIWESAPVGGRKSVSPGVMYKIALFYADRFRSISSH